MTLYHGSTMVVDKLRIITTEYGRDFGSGFYTTGIKEQAIRWAKRKAKLTNRNGIIVKAVVSIYAFDEKNFGGLSIIRFPEPSMEWLNMVCLCRGDMQYRHNYDMIIGKIANDDVGETVSFVMRGIMRKEDALDMFGTSAYLNSR